MAGVCVLLIYKPTTGITLDSSFKEGLPDTSEKVWVRILLLLDFV